MKDDKVYKVNIYTINPNKKFKYTNESLKEIIKTFVNEKEYYKIGELLIQKTSNKNFFKEIITGTKIPVYKTYDEEIKDIYGYKTEYHIEYPTENPTFAILKEYKEKEDIKTILGPVRVTTEKFDTLHEATNREFQEYYFNNKSSVYTKKKINNLFKQGKINFLSTKFVKPKNNKKIKSASK